MSQKVIVICGPTASGKTLYAHNLAKRHNGVIICADSMQLYNKLQIITASPANDLKNELPYLLYNELELSSVTSVVQYAQMASNAVLNAIERNELPIIVGGSGMYINALIYGYSQIPDITSEVRHNVRLMQKQLGQEAFFRELQALDPKSAQNIRPADTQRSCRAYEVFVQTGQSIMDFWHSNYIMPLEGLNIEVFFLHPPRAVLYERCNYRLVQMFKSGAIAEVAAVRDEIVMHTAMAKAVGVRELIDYLDNKITLADALCIAQNRTRQYAKRQITWFTHQLHNKIIIKEV